MSKNEIPKIKPFPRLCPSCRERAVYPTVARYATKIAYEGKIYPVVVKRLKTPRCRRCQYIFPDLDAHDQITIEFLRQMNLLTPDEIRSRREALNLTQKQLASYLGIAEATLSRWETAGQIQQRSLDNLLRIFFAFPEVRRKLMKKQVAKLGLVADKELVGASA